MEQVAAEAPQPHFDFDRHAETATTEFLKQQAFFIDLSIVLRRILQEALDRRGVKVQSIEARTKDPASFAKKVSRPSDSDPSRPKYPEPLRQITDLAAARVITYFPSAIAEVDKVIEEEFQVVERSDKGAALLQEERFGYNSVHYLVRLSEQRARLPEYKRFSDVVVEIQVRTVLQHAWAEIEHDIQYKSTAVIPSEIKRRFMALAGVLEMADNEFQAIQDEDARLTREARTRVEGGHLENVQITPDALKAFLDKNLGPDARISDFSYNWTARLLLRLGFKTLDQVKACIDGYDDDSISRVITKGRRGQTTRFEYMLLAGMGEVFLKRHPFSKTDWFPGWGRDALEALKEASIPIKGYDPRTG